jgi:hypothetical protein
MFAVIFKKFSGIFLYFPADKHMSETRVIAGVSG